MQVCNNFLWLTRGKTWGFRFLSEPSGLPFVEAIYKFIFLKDESRVGYWKGIILEKWHYVACRCYDDQAILNDAAGRRIPHEFLIICSPDEQNELVNKQWGPGVIEKTRAYFLQQYDSVEPQKCIIDFDLVTTTMSPNEEGSETIDVPFSCIKNKGAGVSKYKKYYRAFLLSVLFLLFAGCVLGLLFCLTKKQQNNCCVQDIHPSIPLEQADVIANQEKSANESLTIPHASSTGDEELKEEGVPQELDN